MILAPTYPGTADCLILAALKWWICYSRLLYWLRVFLPLTDCEHTDNGLRTPVCRSCVKWHFPEEFSTVLLLPGSCCPVWPWGWPPSIQASLSSLFLSRGQHLAPKIYRAQQTSAQPRLCGHDRWRPTMQRGLLFCLFLCALPHPSGPWSDLRHGDLVGSAELWKSQCLRVNLLALETSIFSYTKNVQSHTGLP